MTTVYTVIFLLAVLVLSLGIDATTGITGKDEYFLSHRTPLTMMEQDRWWVPWLDEAPRLKKPPMLYWLGRASYEVFGPSAASARIIGVSFAALLVMLTAMIAYRLTENRRYSLLSAFIVLSTLSLAVEGRRMMLDIPSTAFSAMAFYAFLRWRSEPRAWVAVLGAAGLAAGLLTKGPLTLMLFGSGLLALFMTAGDVRRSLMEQPGHVVLYSVVLLGLALPWFVYVYLQFPETSLNMLQEDAGSRQLFSFSSAPVSAFFLLSIPWSFVLLQTLLQPRYSAAAPTTIKEQTAFLMLWLLISLLPFFFFRSFARYMAGSIVPMALLLACAMHSADIRGLRWSARLGMLLGVVVTALFCGAALWFKLALWTPLLTLIPLGLFVWVWWNSRHVEAMALSAALLWMLLLGAVYPQLGINYIPGEVYERVGDKDVILFAGPQPALLAITKGRAYYRTKYLKEKDLSSTPLIFTPLSKAVDLEKQLQDLKQSYTPQYRYKALNSRGTWARFTRRGTTQADWRRAFAARSLEGLKTEIVLYGPVASR